jgi:hypothetical protein
MTMATTKRDIRIHDSLTVVKIDTFKTEDSDDSQGLLDPPGSANFLVNVTGFANDLQEDEEPILWTDYEGEGTDFSILIDSGRSVEVRETCARLGYEVISIAEVTEPCQYGSGTSGTVAICKHPDGWIVIES